MITHSGRSKRYCASTSSFRLDLLQPKDQISRDIGFSSPTPLPTCWMERNKVPIEVQHGWRSSNTFLFGRHVTLKGSTLVGLMWLKFGGHRAKECFYHLLKVHSCSESMFPFSGTESPSPELALCSYSTLHLNQNIHFFNGTEFCICSIARCAKSF